MWNRWFAGLTVLTALSSALFLIASLARATPVPLPLTGSGTGPVRVEKVRVNNPAVLPLSGMWKFRVTRGRITPAGFVSAGNGPATASSAQDGHSPAEALEGGAGWCAEDSRLPQWWRVDLGKPETVSSLSLRWEYRDAFYRFTVEGSLDGAVWKTLADKTAEPGVHDGSVSVPSEPVRFLRVNVVGIQRASGTAWAFLREAKIQVVRNGAVTAWTPQPVSEDVAVRDAFSGPSFPDSYWRTIPVPANWEMEGFSRPTYNDPDDAVGLYRREVTMPAGFAGKRVIWHFDGVYDGAEVFVNGTRVGYHESGFSAFDLDVTQAIKPGQKNLLALRVSKNTPSSPLDSGDYWALGGIYRENYMVAVPALSVDDLTLVTDLDKTYTDATLRMSLTVKGKTGDNFTVAGSLYRGDGSPVPLPAIRGQGTVGVDGTATVDLRQTVPAPRLWSAEKPNLYYVVLRLGDGQKIVETIQERFGFKSIEIKNGVLLWNGVPIKTTGTCRHEEWAALGHALTEQAWQTDVALMKAANINAVRTSHYNHAQRFLELCEEKGLYILDEAAGCWAKMDDPTLTPGMVRRTQEMYARDKNRPCVLAWSIGNESGVGPVNKAAFAWIKEKDPTHPAFISQASTWADPRMDFDDRHYPTLAEMQRLVKDKARAVTPLLLTEQPHMYYGENAASYDPGFHDYWVISLKNNWDLIWKSDAVVGSFIWEWQDQGIADKYPDGGRDPKTNLRSNNEKGFVDGYRNVKPEYFHVKMVYSPVIVAAREVQPVGGAAAVGVENRYSFTDLSDLSCRWEALAGAKTLARGVKRVSCPPRSLGSARFTVPAGTDVLRLEFIHPDGRSVYATRLAVKNAASAAAPPSQKASGRVILEDAAASVRVFSGNTELVVDKKTGRIQSWKNDQALIIGGPALNLGERRNPQGALKAENFLFSHEPPQLRNAQVSAVQSARNAARVTVTSDVYLAESPEKKATLTYTLTVNGENQMDVAWKLNWIAPDANAWELGMTLALPAPLTTMRWQRDTLWTEYPAGHPGAPSGRTDSRDISFRGTKRDIRTMTLTEKGGWGLETSRLETPLHMRANAGGDAVTLFASTQVEPPKNHNESTPELDIHLKQGQVYEGSFRLRAMGENKAP